jgi:hypothetical protein
LAGPSSLHVSPSLAFSTTATDSTTTSITRRGDTSIIVLASYAYAARSLAP